MILILDIAVAAAIIYFLMQFFVKLIAGKVFKKTLPKWGKAAMAVLSVALAALCFLNDKP
jgi:hypothetical protein